MSASSPCLSPRGHSFPWLRPKLENIWAETAVPKTCSPWYAGGFGGRVPLLHWASFLSWIIKFHHSTCMVFDKRILNKGLGTIFQSFLVGIKVASDIQTEPFSATEFDLFSSCQALNPESTSWRSFDSPIQRKLVKNLHHQKVSVKSVATPWEHTSSRYRTSTVNRLTQAD